MDQEGWKIRLELKIRAQQHISNAGAHKKYVVRDFDLGIGERDYGGEYIRTWKIS